MHDFIPRPANRPQVKPTPHDGPLRWLVPSASRPGESHLVELDAYRGTGRCSCPDFTCRLEPVLRRPGEIGKTDKLRCKHIRLVRGYFLDQIIESMATGVKALVGLCMLTCMLNAAPSEAMLDALAWTESRNNPAAIGDGGDARGAYQLHRGAFLDAQEAAGGVWGPWEVSAHDPKVSRAAARAYCGIIEARLRRAGLTPTPTRVWLAWSMGYFAARSIDFDPRKAPLSKRRGLVRLLNRLGKSPSTI